MAELVRKVTQVPMSTNPLTPVVDPMEVEVSTEVMEGISQPENPIGDTPVPPALPDTILFGPETDGAAITQWMNEVSDTICKFHNIEPIPFVLEGQSTAVVFNRMRTGYSISVGVKALTQPTKDYLNRILHEIVHVINDRDFVRDVCGSGAYHTDAFKNVAESIDVTATWSKSYGFAGSVVSNNLEKYEFDFALDTWLLSNKTQLLNKNKPRPKAESTGGSSKFAAKVYEIVCPHCGEVLYVRKGELVEKPAMPNGDTAADDLI